MCNGALVIVTYHLVGRVVGLQLLVVGVLHEDGMVADDGCDGGVIVHHRLSRLLSVHLQKCLRSYSTLINLTVTAGGTRILTILYSVPSSHSSLTLTHLVFALEHQQIGHFAKGES